MLSNCGLRTGVTLFTSPSEHMPHSGGRVGSRCHSLRSLRLSDPTITGGEYGAADGEIARI